MQEEQLIKIMICGLLALVIGIKLVNVVVIQFRGYRNRRQPILTAPAVALYKHPGIEPVFIGPRNTFLHHITFRTESGLEMKLNVSPDVYHIIPEGVSGDLIWQGENLIRFSYKEPAEAEL